MQVLLEVIVGIEDHLILCRGQVLETDDCNPLDAFIFGSPDLFGIALTTHVL